MDAAVSARISRAARIAGRVALERRTEVKMVRCGSPGRVISCDVVPRPVQTRSGMRATAFPDSISRICA